MSGFEQSRNSHGIGIGHGVALGTEAILSLAEDNEDEISSIVEEIDLNEDLQLDHLAELEDAEGGFSDGEGGEQEPENKKLCN